MLQAKDLQIGDLVRIKDDVEPDAYFLHGDMRPSQPVKVEEILSIGINPDWYGGEINTILPYDAIEPIPLTPDILQENVWEGHDEYGMLIDTFTKGKYVAMWNSCGEDCSGDLEVEFNKHGAGTIQVKFNVSGHYYVTDEIRYVHELQRALRCVGLFELANNIKL